MTEDKKVSKAELSYCYFSGKGGGDAPVLVPQARARRVFFGAASARATHPHARTTSRARRS